MKPDMKPDIEPNMKPDIEPNRKPDIKPGITVESALFGM